MFDNININENIPAIVLAGGFGTRLRSEIGENQKAIAPVGETTFLFYQLKNWRSQGIKNFIFLLHYKAEKVISLLKEYVSSEFNDIDYRYLIEPVPLGTGGSILSAIDHFQIKSRFWVFNADTWVPNFYRSFESSAQSQVGVCWMDDVDRYGTVEFDSKNIISNFIEKSGAKTPGWVNAGISILSVADFKFTNEKVFSLEDSIFKPLVSVNRLKVAKLQQKFIDIGVPTDYKKFQHLKS